MNKTMGAFQSTARIKILSFSVWIVLLILVMVISIFSDVFLTTSNIINILRLAAIIGVAGVGMTYVMIGGNFDLSVGATIAFAAIVSIKLQPVGIENTLVAIIVPLLLGITIGIINGILIGYLGLNPFITTLGLQSIILGTTFLYTKGQHVWVFEAHELFESIGNGFVGIIPISVIILFSVVVIGQLVLSYTNYGLYIKTVGANKNAATLSGINASKTICISFMIVGFCAALGGVILASWVKNLDPSSGIGYEFEIITAVVLGGTSLLGGRGNVANTFAGVIILMIIANAMTLLNISYHFQLMIRGIILIAVVIFDNMSRRRSK